MGWSNAPFKPNNCSSPQFSTLLEVLNFTFDSTPQTLNLLQELPNFGLASRQLLGNIRRRPETFWGHLRTSLETSPDSLGRRRMRRYEDKGARPEGSGCSVWTSAGAHGSRTQAKPGINMDVHQAPCPLPPCLSLCAAMTLRVPANSISSMAATSSHAKVINKHPQMARDDSLQSDAECRDGSLPLAALFAFEFITTLLQLHSRHNNFHSANFLRDGEGSIRSRSDRISFEVRNEIASDNQERPRQQI